MLTQMEDMGKGRDESRPYETLRNHTYHRHAGAGFITTRNEITHFIDMRGQVLSRPAMENRISRP